MFKPDSKFYEKYSKNKQKKKYGYIGKATLKSDKKGHKHYFYTKDHVRTASSKKFRRLREVCKRINDIRRMYVKMMKTGIDTRSRKQKAESLRTRLLGAYLMIADKCLLRPGSIKFKKKNNTIGFTTFEPKHVSFGCSGAKKCNCVTIKYIGKNSIKNECKLCDDKFYENMKLFISNDSDPTNEKLLGRKRDYISKLLNEESYVGTDKYIFVKDLRTYGANVEFLKQYNKLDPAVWKFLKEKGSGSLMYHLARPVSKRLFNETRVTLSHYIHPRVKRFALTNRPNKTDKKEPESLLCKILN